MRTRTYLAACLLAMIACEGERSLDLLGDEPIPPTESPEETQRRLRMNITATFTSDSGVTHEIEISARDLARQFVVQDSLDELLKDPGGLPFGAKGATTGCAGPGDFFNVDGSFKELPTAVSPNLPKELDCDVALCRTQATIAVANRLLELSTAAAPVTFRGQYSGASGATWGTISILPDDEESRVALTQEAFAFGAWATTAAGETLRGAAGRSTLRSCTDTQLAARFINAADTTKRQSYGQSFAVALGDATLVADEAARAAVRHHTAVADGSYAEVSDVATASKLAWTNKDISRAQAVHLLVGGAPGLAGVTGGICPVPPPSGGAWEAIEVVRLAAPAPPALVEVATVDFETLFEDATTVIVDGSPVLEPPLRARLADRLGDSRFHDMSAEQFLEDRGLTEGDFLEARNYLAGELAAFARDRSQTLPPMPVASSRDGSGAVVEHTTMYPIYAATGTRPSPAPAAYHRSIARFAGGGATLLTSANDGVPVTSTKPVTPSKTYAQKGLAQLLDYSLSVASDIARQPATWASGTEPITVVEVLSEVVEGLRSGVTTWGRLESCYSYLASPPGFRDDLRLRAYGYLSTPGTALSDEYRVVLGPSGLRCAVEGQVDGAPCNLDGYPPPLKGDTAPIYKTSSLSSGEAGFTSYIEIVLNLQYDASFASSPPALYLVRKRPNVAPAPGNYEALGGVYVIFDHSALGTRYCTLQPVSPTIDDLVEAVLGPSTEFCGRAEETCAGMDRSARIPLESELSTDNDAYESSWRVYLARADDAANRADALGEELIRSGVEIDTQMQVAAEAIEELCGVPVNAAQYFPSPSTPAWLGTCAATLEGEPCGSDADGGVCRNGVCVRDALGYLRAKAETDSTARKLLECLGDEGIAPFVTLGSDPVCVWVDPESGLACDPVLSDATCPWRPTGGDCVAPAGVNPAYVEDVDTTLGLFTPADISGTQGERACSALRALRDPSVPAGMGTEANPGRDVYVAEVAGFLNWRRLQSVAKRTTWQARVADYSGVALGAGDLFATGDAEAAGASGLWPCGYEPYAQRENPARVCTVAADRPELQPSLFCSYTEACGINAVDRSGRVLMNHRLGRAVLALRIMTGAGLTGFRGPFWLEPPDLALAWPGGATYLGPDMDFVTTPVPTKLANDQDGDSVDDVKFGAILSLGAGMTFPYKLPVTGRAYCLDAADGPAIVWTDWPDGFQEGDDTGLPYACDFSDTAVPFPVVFKTYAESQGDEAERIVETAWKGLGTLEDLDRYDGSDHTAFTALVLGLLRDPPLTPAGYIDEDAVWISPSEGPGPGAWGGPVYQTNVQKLTRYWKDDKWNRVAIARDGLRVRDILDGLELACELERLDGANLGDTAGECTAPVAVDDTMGSLRQSERYLQCVAQQLITESGTQVIQDLPLVVVSALQGTQLKFEGRLGAASARLAGALINLRGLERDVTSTLQSFAKDLSDLQFAIEELTIQDQLGDLQMASEIANQTASCVGAIAGAIEAAAGALLNGAGGATGFGAFVSCSNAATQIGIIVESHDLTERLIDLKGDRSWEDIKASLRQHADVLADIDDQMDRELKEVSAAVADIDTARLDGRRALSKMMFAGSDMEGRQFALNTVTRRRFNTLQIRYEQAKWDAIRMAWIARRAVEQHLGLDLSGMLDDMLLVDAPARWADSVCTFQGIDYLRIRDETGLLSDDYADAYIGDYVRKLELVVASYEHDFPFTDSQDTAVVSLRDDVVHSRQECPTEVPNLLAYSGRLDLTSDPADAASEPCAEGSCPDPVSVWRPSSCTGPGGALDAGLVEDLVSVIQLPGDSPDDRPLWERFGEVRNGYRVTFLPSGGAGEPITTECALGQSVTLSPGVYRLSWYGRGVTGSALTPANAVTVRPAPEAMTTSSSQATLGWDRHHLLFKVAAAATYEIAVVPVANTAGEQPVDLAGFMLEDVTGLLLWSNTLPVTSAYPPSAYIATQQAGIGERPLCPDSDGSVFRTEWERGCTPLCPAGFGDCDLGVPHCYWELPFNITVDGIEQGGVLSQAGFAYGNYNYRFDWLAVNFVGTGVIDCTGSLSPETCYASANIPFSIEHVGPYEVRNHEGAIYQAPLFTGYIEHGRGLAAERYITNPISTADRALLEPYAHRELRGRPLTGGFRLRVWDSDGADLGNLEDVQVILGYRYWTRFK